MARLFIEKLKCIKKTDDPGKNDEVYMDLRTDGLEGRIPDKGYWEMSEGWAPGDRNSYSVTSPKRRLAKTTT